MSSSMLEEEEGVVGAVGEYTFIQPTFWEPSKLQKWAQPIGAVLSVLYPPLAPFIAAAATTIATDGDVQEGIKSGAETYVKGKVTDITKDKILDAYEAIDIPVRELDLYTQSKIVNVTNDVLAVKSGTESSEDAVKSILWKNIKDEAGYSFEDFDSKFDFSLPDFGLSGLDIDLPDLPDIDLPDVHLPDVNLPDVNLPDVNLPDVNLNLPDMPDLGVDLDLPDLDLDLSGIETPEFDFDLDLEGLDTEGLDIEMPEMPDVDIDLPSLNLSLKQQEEEKEEESEVEEMFLPELFRHDTQVKYTQGLIAPKINLRKFSK